VKILALSDEVLEPLYSPQIKERFADVDLIIGCGDLPFYYLDYIVSMLNRPLYYVPGNHDRPRQLLSDGRVVRRAAGGEPLDGRVARVRTAHGDVVLAGLGGCLRYNFDGQHQYTQAEMAARVLALTPRLLMHRLRYRRPADILVTHAPPRGIHDQPDRTHTGFDAFLSFMKRFRPRFLLHGHAHVYRRGEVIATRYGDTQVINVYPCKVIEFEKDYVGQA
jgi:Icc-related predicted phosphoesterase